jgi:secreted PhoX family phosphatase
VAIKIFLRAGIEASRVRPPQGAEIWRWATNGTPGSEFTGLYFDPTNKRRAWVNIQHPSSGNDRTIEIRIPR